MRLLPAIDLRGGCCVRLQQGDYNRERVYGEDPAAMGRHWESLGATELHLVDLDGAKAGEPVQREIVASIAAAVGIRTEIGGGIASVEDAAWYLEHGVDHVILGSLAVREPELTREIMTRFPGQTILAVDARDGMVATRGWLEASDLTAEEVVRRFSDLDIAMVDYTDISRDGMLSGPNVDATAELAAKSPFPVVASGGVSSLEDLRGVAEAGRKLGDRLYGVIVGQALYSGAFTLPEALEIFK